MKFLSLFLAATICSQLATGQASTVYVSVAPMLGFDMSVGTLHAADKRDDFHSISGATSRKDFSYGLGLQVHLLDNWQATLRYAGTGLSSAYRYKEFEPNPNGAANGGRGRRGVGQRVNRWSFTVERSIAKVTTLSSVAPNVGLLFNGGIGISYTGIPQTSRSDTPVILSPVSISNFGIREVGYKHVVRNRALGLNLGLNTQISVRDKKRLKLGIWYHYIPKPPVEFEFTVAAQTGPKDHFRLLAAKHQFLFFAEFPIKVFGFKY